MNDAQRTAKGRISEAPTSSNTFGICGVLALAAIILEIIFYSMSSGMYQVFWSGTSAFSIAAFVYYLVNSKSYEGYTRFLDVYVVILLAFLALQFCLTAIEYGQSLVNFFRAGYFYLYILLTYAALGVFVRKKGISQLLDAVMILTSATCLAHIANAFLLNSVGAGFLDVTSAQRLDTLRVYTLPTLINMSIAYSAYRTLSKGEGASRGVRVLHLLCCATCLFCEIYVRQSRAEILVSTAVIIVIAICVYSDARKRVALLAVFLAAGALLVSSGYLDAFMDTFSTSGAYANSTSNRIFEMSYYWEMFLKHPLMGTGILNGYANGMWYSVLHGGAGVYWANDIGLIGTFGSIGIFALFLYVLPVFRMISISVRGLKINAPKAPFLFGLAVMVTLSSATLIPFGESTILAWPFFLAIFEYENVQIRHLCERKDNEGGASGKKASWRRHSQL